MKRIQLYIILLIVSSFFNSCKKEKSNKSTTENQSIAFNLPEGFELEDLYHPSSNGQGSWVALTQGASKIYACDQRGKIYAFMAPESGQTIKTDQIDSVALEIGQAHGLLWAHNALYVSVNKNWDDDVPDSEEKGSGIYKLTDSNADGKLDKVTMLLKLQGEGEHGPHSLVLSPSGNKIYFIAGNHTLIPESLLKNSRLPTNWGEDNLFEPYLDARGHANDIKAPGGWIAKFDPDGTHWEIISAGYRNPFDMAFNQDGELFAYDSDMEWDIGMPWYRPTRICHVTSGSEYGWRTGSGKWPAYYPDNLSAVQNTEQGSPTAVLSGANLSFPSKYKNGLLVMDWSFGTVYYINLKTNGSSYTAEKEEFLSGAPLPLTDMIAGSDGNLYFATGGRGLDSHLYRLSYKGPDNTQTEIELDEKSVQQRKLRHSLEKYHTEHSSEAIPLAWDNLNNKDRFIRYAARIVLEHQPVTQWQARFFVEKDAVKVIEAGIALARHGAMDQQGKIINKLNQLSLESLTTTNQIALLRNYSLLFIRMGEPNTLAKKATIKKLQSYFPHTNNAINRELGQLLLFLKAEGITEELVGLLEKHTLERTISEGVQLLSKETTMRSEQYGPLIREVIEKMPPSEAIYYGLLLSHAKEGWTKESRGRYFSWFFDVLGAKGGRSFKAYMENVRQKAMTHVLDNEKEYFKKLSGVYSPSTELAELPKPIGPGGNYSGKELYTIFRENGKNNIRPTIAQGERAFKAAMCILCHRIRGEGGGAGPDLTQVHTKFGSYDLLFAIFSPNDEISDQYANALFHLNDGKRMVGRVKSEVGDSITIAPNPFNENYTIKLAKSSIEKRENSPISPMPPGLLNRLNEQEILNLLVYLRSGGDTNYEGYNR